MNLQAEIGLDSSQFQAGLAGIRNGVSGALTQLRGIGSAIAPALGLGAALAGAGAGAALLGKSIGAAMGAETLAVQLKVLTGSAETARAVLADLTEFSDVTPFEPEPVMQAGRALLAFGFQARELKPLLADVGDLASGMGADIGDVANAFGRLKSGQFGEAFERMRSLGVTRTDLEGQGLKFDNAGSFVGSAEQAMTAVRAVIQDQFGGTMEAMSQTSEGLLSTLKGNVTAIYRELGIPINDALRPALREAIKIADQLKLVLAGSIKAGTFGEIIGLSIEHGAERGMQAFQGMLVAMQEILGQAFASLFEPSMWKTMVFGFTSAANEMGAALLDAFAGPLKSIQDSFTWLAETEAGASGKRKHAEKLDAEVARLETIRDEYKEIGQMENAAGAQKSISLVQQQRADLGYVPRTRLQIEREDKFSLGGNTSADLRATASQYADRAKQAQENLKQTGVLSAEEVGKAWMRSFSKPTEASVRLKQLLEEAKLGGKAPAGGDLSGHANATTAAAARSGGKSLGIESDRLAKVGLFVGGIGGDSAMRPAMDTARNTAAILAAQNKTIEVITKRLPVGNLGAVIWA